MGILSTSRLNYAIIAGIISGILLAILGSLLLGYHFVPYRSAYILGSLCLLPYPIWLVTIGTGYLTIRHSMACVRSKRDAAVIAGAAGVISSVVNNLLQAIVVLVLHYGMGYYIDGFPGQDFSLLALIPILMIISTVFNVAFTAVGGLAYVGLKTKIR